MNVFFVIR